MRATNSHPNRQTRAAHPSRAARIAITAGCASFGLGAAAALLAGAWGVVKARGFAPGPQLEELDAAEVAALVASERK